MNVEVQKTYTCLRNQLLDPANLSLDYFQLPALLLLERLDVVLDGLRAPLQGVQLLLKIVAGAREERLGAGAGLRLELWPFGLGGHVRLAADGLQPLLQLEWLSEESVRPVAFFRGTLRSRLGGGTGRGDARGDESLRLLQGGEFLVPGVVDARHLGLALRPEIAQNIII